MQVEEVSVNLRTGGRRFSKSVYVLASITILAVVSASAANAQTKAYIVHPGPDVVTVIDTATGTPANTVPVGAGSGHVAISRDGSRAYVSSADSDSVNVIDTATDSVVATIPVGDAPSYLAVAPNGTVLYVMTAGGIIDVVNTTQQIVTATVAVGGTGGLAVTPDGARLYAAAGQVSIIDTATNAVVTSFAPEASAVAGVTNTAGTVVISPDGARAYVGVITFDTTVFAGFAATGSVVVVDTASESIAGAINLGSLPGSMALTPDGSRLYVGIQSTFVNTGYGMGFFPGRHAYVIDTAVDRISAVIDFGAIGPNWTQQNTPAGIGVTADRRSVYVAVPRLNAIAIADVSTNLVTSTIPVASGPGNLAIVPDDSVVPVPYRVDASDDSATVTTVGGTAVANVLANDRLGGFAATNTNVTLTQQSSTAGSLTLDSTTGTVTAANGITIGTHTLDYRICEIASPSNCDDATVTVTVRAPFIIDAVNDSATTLPGRGIMTSVLANDTLDGTPATPARVTLSLVRSTSASIQLNPRDGTLFVLVGTTPGAHTLTYRICEIASPTNCDDADVAVTVNAFPIDAVNDNAAAPRSGGVALGNVLANDTFAGAGATLAKVRLSQVSSTHAGVMLNTATGAVSVAAGTPVGSYSLQYRICEIATPANCDEAAVAVAVTPLQITATNDVARGSSKTANTPLASVLTNDRLAGAPATTANVKLSLVSLVPANNMIRLDLADGSVDVLGKTSSGTYSLTYQICETAMLTNCARAVVSIDLSGK
jgi:YVTN family beta-propeller protein